MEMNKNYLREQLKKYPGFFGRNGKFYQSLDGVVSEDEARRPTTERLTKYGVLDVINKDTDILDIGCNAGFISLTAAKKAKSVLGLESEPELTNIANGAKSIVNQSNCEFQNIKFENFETTKKYDVIFTLAIHHWVKLGFVQFFDKVMKMMKQDSYLMFESHNIKNQAFDADIDGKIWYLNQFFKIVNHGHEETDEKQKMDREFYLLKRKRKPNGM